MKPPSKFASIPLQSEREKQENALFDKVMDVFDKLKPSNIVVVHTMMRIAASAAIYGGGNAEGFAAGARKSFEEAVETQRLASEKKR